ncbi:choice-of-anchor A family protein [Luteolibacter sp. GHJ8]|uniref:Choice-of-anchor A family protein n=1 Tax=Luteolibacter rhizosphaerae TaxID=2989719 RepID=A0ABT3GA31_9BACT|nr:choice-of-anchor A family protein [Luteolibacter rhizosphaerae]MCW1916070.1 choice-of-anchor A family protein [Luteolibacter rhizosphaerae]
MKSPVLALLLASSAALHATTLSVASNYNVYVLGTMNESNTDAEGRVAVAGNATLNGYGVGSSFSSSPSSAGNSLVVGGNLVMNGEVQYGNLVHGGTLSGGFGVPRGSITHGSAVDFNTTNSYLLNASSYWGGLASTGNTAVQAWGGIYLSGSNSDLNIFTLSGAALASTNTLAIDAPSGSTVLVNVTGDYSRMFQMGFSFWDINNDGRGTVSRQNVIYNFVDATSLDLGGVGIQGSILAPRATVNFNNGNIDGNLIAGNLFGSGEAHNYLFQGTLPTPVTVPEPSAFLLSCLTGALLVWRRRR